MVSKTYFVPVEQVLNPELKGKPVIIGGDPQRRGVVTFAFYEARPFGIHAGMPLYLQTKRSSVKESQNARKFNKGQLNNIPFSAIS